MRVGFIAESDADVIEGVPLRAGWSWIHKIHRGPTQARGGGAKESEGGAGSLEEGSSWDWGVATRQLRTSAHPIIVTVIPRRA